jgi:hypothetical protein
MIGEHARGRLALPVTSRLSRDDVLAMPTNLFA